MSTVAFIRRMLDAGFSHDDALRAAEAFEATAAEIAPEPDTETSGARRTRRWRERKASHSVTERHETSQSVTSVTCPPPLPLSPQTPLTPTPPPGENTPREGVPARGPTRAQIASGFLAFWAAYPNRKGKDAAAKAFDKAMRRIEAPDPLAVILAGIERALPGWDDPKYIPHPSTWLNRGQWDDEAPTPRNGLTRHDRPNRPDKTAERAANFAAAWSGADGAAQILADRGRF